MTEKFIEDRIDTLETQAENHSTRLMKLQDRIGFVEGWHDNHEKRIGVIDNLRKRVEELMSKVAKTEAIVHQARKTAFKGGWINLYYTRPGQKVRVGALNASREEADIAATGDDHRVACIYIPDFAEGEGL